MADDKVFNTLEDIADELISSNKKVHLIYAFNATGKTRLSTILKDKLNISENDGESKYFILTLLQKIFLLGKMI